MTNKPLPLFESLAAVFGIAVVALLVALPSTGSSEEESTERLLRDNLRQVRTAVREFVESGTTLPASSEEFEAILLQDYLTEIPPNPSTSARVFASTALPMPSPERMAQPVGSTSRGKSESCPTCPPVTSRDVRS
jgi:hypothetical protein